MADAAAHILLIEDESAIAQTVVYALEREGFAVTHCFLGRDGVAQFQTHGAALVLLDIGLPDSSGFAICKELQATAPVPVIFLTARSDEVDRVVGLELGGDDYITKPFSPRELVARVRAVLRRVPPAATCGESPPAAQQVPAQPQPGMLQPDQPQSGRPGQPPTTAQHATPAHQDPNLPACSRFRVDTLRHIILYNDVSLALTKYEYLLLCALLASPGQVLSRGQIMEQAWDSADTSLERSVDTHVKSLRAKLKQVDPACNPIITHRGFGYSLDPAAVHPACAPGQQESPPR